jgi:mannan endo-1,4-beta-mannosidase
MLKGKIAAHYPGTKLAFTEYNYGAGGDISGGIAQADVLGIFGQQGVFAANMWPLSAVTYIDAAFNMYQDPAGNGTKVGDTSVSTVDSDTVNTSAYGFVNSANANEVDAVVINKTASPMTTTVQITNPTSLTSVKVYQLTSASASPQAAGTFAVQNNQYQYTMPAYSVSTLVFTGTGSNPAPTVTLSANPASITSGQSSTLTWSSTSATSCTGTGFTVSGTSGSVSVSPTSNTTYSITCTGSGGSASANATVNVTTTTPPALQVTPNTNISASGTQGGPFSPSSFSYTLRTASGNVKYSITTPSWLTASSTSGTVTTSAKTITFTVNSKARSLGPSTYVNNIGFNNTTSNQGSTTRLATLTVNPKQHTITVGASPSADGTVSGGGTFAEGSSHTVIAAPNGGHSFVHWTENGRVVSTSESYTFTLNGNVTLVADFR